MITVSMPRWFWIVLCLLPAWVFFVGCGLAVFGIPGKPRSNDYGER
jgi:hypothetical protein